ncbi:MAG: AAA family ATPase [Thermodesulfobacteriota bacterium]
MTKQADLEKLSNLFKRNNRWANFGPVLNGVNINGFRGINDLDINFESPIIAFSGINGSGKSTIIQLLSCAYRKPVTEVSKKRRYYIKDFFNMGLLDPSPFTTDAKVMYKYTTSKQDYEQTVTVTRATHEWSGYKRQPERITSYVGFTFYIPKVERRDFSVYHSQHITVEEGRLPSEEAMLWTKRILGNVYEQIDFATVRHANKEAEVGRLKRNGARYSENNMGFGEARILYFVDLLENSPDNSLFVFEEPETSLHPVAQYKFAEYLLNVVLRKKHQIFLSTHSENLLDGLPVESRKFLIREGTKIYIVNGISINQAKCFLSGYNFPALLIIVEDKVSRILTTEIIRCIEPNLIPQINIEIGGDKKELGNVVRILKSFGKNVIGFRDADIGENQKEKLYSLPGSQAPEREILNSNAVKEYLNKVYKFNVENYLSENPDLNHHEYFEKIAMKIAVFEEVLITESARIYSQDLSKEEKEIILQKINSNL